MMKKTLKIVCLSVIFVFILTVTVCMSPFQLKENSAYALSGSEPGLSNLEAEQQEEGEHFAAQTENAAELPYVDGQVLVEFENNLTAKQEDTVIGKYGVQSESRDNISVIELENGKTVEQAVEELKTNPNVSAVQPNYIYSLLENNNYKGMTTIVNDTMTGAQEYLDNICMWQAWDYSRTNKAVRVAVLDTGIVLGHPDLVNNIVFSWDAYNNAPLAGDLTGHGTHVAGIIAAEANNKIGIAGVSYNAAIIAINVFHYTGSGYASDTFTLCKGIDIAVERGARVVNMSLGSYTSGTSEEDLFLKGKIDAAAAAGVVSVCAGGNGDANGNPITAKIYPGDFESCISVVPICDWDDGRAYWADYNNCKDISAPGVAIYSTVPTFINKYGYDCFSGSSMAAPMVSGAVAAAIALNPGMSVERIKDLMYKTAVDLGSPGYDPYYGHGKLNALNFMNAVYYTRYPNAALTMISLDGTNPNSTYNPNFSMAANITGRTISSMFFNVYNADLGRQTSAYYTGTKDMYGTWRATFDLEKHSNAYGNYVVEVYMTDANGITFGLGGKAIRVVNMPPEITMISLDGTNPASTTNKNFPMAANINPKGKTINSMFFNVYNADLGRQTSVYFYGSKDVYGTWRTNFDFRKYGCVTGNYVVEVYATDSRGITYGLGGKTIRVVNIPPEMTMISLDGTNPASTTNFNFSMAANIKPNGKTISTMFFNVYNADTGRQTSKYFYGSKDAYGTWRANFDFSKYGYISGNYVVEVYVTDSDGITYGMGGKSIRVVNVPPEMTMISIDSTNPDSTINKTFPMAANINPKGKTISSMFFNVYNIDVGRQTSRYYYGSKDVYGTWRAAFDLADYSGVFGNYVVEVYVRDSQGILYGMGGRAIQVKDTPPALTSITLNGANPAATYDSGFPMTAIIDPKGKTISSMFFNVYNIDVGRQTSVYYYGTYDGNAWNAAFDLSRQQSLFGNYVVEVYATDSNNVTYGLGGKAIRVDAKSRALLNRLGFASAGQVVEDSTYLTSFEMNASFNEYGIPLQTVFFNVFNADVGRASSVPYFAAKGSDGIWRATFDLNNHGNVYGNYNIELYAIDERGTTLGFGNRMVQILGMAPLVRSPMDIPVPVPGEEAAPEPSVEPTAEPSEEPTVEPSEEPTAEPEPGVEPTEQPTEEPTTEPAAEPAAEPYEPSAPAQLQTEQYGIIAQPEDMKLTKEQLAEFYQKNASVIPMTLTDEDGVLLQVDANTAFPLYYGMSLDDFIGIVIEEANKESVRPEVVFTQIMADTNFLRFDKTLDIKDYVFTDNQAEEEIRSTEQYHDAAEGIRAAVQHLKCLASTDALQTETADLLWQDTLRGTVINVQGLHNGEEIITMLKRLFDGINPSGLLKADR